MKNLLFITFSLMMLLTACGEDPCPDADHPLDDLTTALTATEQYENQVGFVNETHEYSFKFDVDGVICSVGYQASNTIGDYVIQITDAQNTIVVDESMNFPKGEVTYRGVPEVNVIANEIYTIRRICMGCQQDSLMIGRVLKAINSPFNPTLNLPQENLGFTVTSVNLYGTDPGISVAIPRIEIGFEEKE